MSNTTITQCRRNDKHFNGARVFVTVSPRLEDKLNQWFDQHKIFALDFKCKAWNWLIKLRNNLVAREIRRVMKLDDKVTVNFNHKCGCGCGCSPGFNVKGDSLLSSAYWSHNVWIDVDITPEAIDDKTIDSLIEVATAKLNLEKQQNGKV